MKTKWILFVLCLGGIFLFTSCDDNEKESRRISIATVDNPENVSSFFFNLDDRDRTRMMVKSTYLPNYKPKTGQRIIADYSILSEKGKAAPSLVSYEVKLNQVFQILTKGIFDLTYATDHVRDSIGNDPIFIRDVWIGGEYLNVEFSYYGANHTHYINLISDKAKSYDDGYVHLEFRHNSNEDAEIYWYSGIVSFDLESFLVDPVPAEITIMLHWKTYDGDLNKKITFVPFSGGKEERDFTFSEFDGHVE